MNLAVVTRADSNIQNMCDITHPVLRRYADFLNAEFVILSDAGKYHPHYRILQCKELLNGFDRLLLIDSDVLITANTPNIFDIVSETHIGSIFEDKGSRLEHRRALIKQVQEERGDVSWKKNYINTGFFVISACHKEIFDNIDTDNLWLHFGQDDIEIGYQINKLDIPIYKLSFRWNMMSMFSEKFNNYASRFDSHVLHYAGNGFYQTLSRDEQIKRDYILLKKYGKLF